MSFYYKLGFSIIIGSLEYYYYTMQSDITHNCILLPILRIQRRRFPKCVAILRSLRKRGSHNLFA